MQYTICKLCDKNIANHSFSQHLKTHKICPKLYHTEYINKNDSDTCCMCTNKTKWVSALVGHKIFCSVCSRKNIPSCKEYWVYNFNYTENAAKQAVKTHQIESSPRRKEYWIKHHNMSIEEANTMVANTQKRDKSWFDYNKGPDAWLVYVERQRYTCSEQHLGKERFDALVKDRKEYTSLEGYIRKFGENGKLKWAKKYGYSTFEEYLISVNTRQYPRQFYMKAFREGILNRQNYLCGMPNCNCGHKQTRDFHLHHINYIKNDMSLDNLIFLCNNCHSKTNYNRSYWEPFLQNVNRDFINEKT